MIWLELKEKIGNSKAGAYKNIRYVYTYRTTKGNEWAQ